MWLLFSEVFTVVTVSVTVSHQHTAAVISSEEILSNVALKGTIKQGTNE